MKEDVKIFNPKAKKERAYKCGHCPRLILKSNEPEGFIYRKDGKPICVVCRATKLSKFKNEIAKDKEKYEADEERREMMSRQNALKETMDIAVASQELAKKGKRAKRQGRITVKNFF